MCLSDKVSIPLSSIEKERFRSASPSELANSFLALSARAFVLGKQMGAVLKDKEDVDMENPKTRLVECASSPQQNKDMVVE